MEPTRHDKLGELLRFLAPGFLHGIGNALFAVQGHCQLVGIGGRDPLREREAILAAAKRGGRLVDVLRIVLGEAGPDHGQQAGVLLRGLAELLRVSLRDRGLTLTLRHSSRETPRQVEGVGFCRALASAVHGLEKQLPTAFMGEVYMDLAAQSESGLAVDVGVQEDPQFLPFPFDVRPLAEELESEMKPAGIRIRAFAEDRRIRLEFPLTETAVFTEVRGNLQGPLTES